MRKIFTFLCAALMSVGMMNAKVTWNSSNISDLSVMGTFESYSKEGVTLNANSDMDYAYWQSLGDESHDGISFQVNEEGGFTFSNTLGTNFTKIEMTLNGPGGWDRANLGSGWNIDGDPWDVMKVIWTGNASTVDLLKEASDFGGATVKSIVFYFVGDSEEPEPAEKPIVVFEANGKKKEVEIESFPHTFKCDLEYKDGELDGIIADLYALPQGGYCDFFTEPVATGNAAVTAGVDDDANHFITISEAFEGTARVSGKYYKFIDLDEEIFDYSLTISIKGDEPEPAKYYIVGNMTNWEVNENYEMNPSLEAETEEYFYGLDLTTTSEFKVVKVEGETKTWYPDGMGNNYGQNGEIERDGEYMIYFRPNMDGGEAWFYNCILAVRHTVAERVVMGFLLPENGMPLTGVKLVGSFEAGMLDLDLNSETGWYVHYNVVAVDEDKFYLRDAADEENFLLAFADGEWDIAEFIFDEVWEDDTWKGEPVKWVELDLSDNSKYAWTNAIPEGVDNITADVKAVKVIRNGEVLILKNGKTFNLLGAEVK